MVPDRPTIPDTRIASKRAYDMPTIAFYPPFESQVDLNDRFFRSLWYLRAFGEATVSMNVSPYLVSPPTVLPLHFDTALAEIDAAGIRYDFRPTGPSDIAATLTGADIIMLWNSDSRQDLTRLTGELGVDIPVWRVDPIAEQHEGPFFLRAVSEFPGVADDLIEESRLNLRSILETIRQPKVYVLCSGPSVATLADGDFSDGLVVICNSLVNNDKLLPILRPGLVVATDPIFHAGVSQYAGAFRDRLQKVMLDYGAGFVTLARDYPVYAAWALPELRSRIAGVPIDRDLTEPSLNLAENFAVMSTSNVLTLMMLPVVGEFAETIVLAGCDGRPIEENDYYWTHDPASQFTDELTNIQSVHPAFFSKTDYDDYYLQHCATLATMIEHLERNGTTVQSMTPSHVPALAERYVPH